MNKRAVGIVGLVVTVCLIVAGFCISVPNREISFREVKSYVGGDAYNVIIEAGLRSGEISGAMVSKTICFAFAGLALILSLYMLEGNAEVKAELHHIVDALRERDAVIEREKLAAKQQEQAEGQGEAES